MNQNRRGFLGLLAGAIAAPIVGAAVVDPERLVWRNGAKLISIPRLLSVKRPWTIDNFNNSYKGFFVEAASVQETYNRILSSESEAFRKRVLEAFERERPHLEWIVDPLDRPLSEMREIRMRSVMNISVLNAPILPIFKPEGY